MKKYIEVQKNKVKDQEQIGAWLSECTANRQPAIVIYYDNDEAYISASITSLLSNADYSMDVDTVKIHDSFSRLSVSYSPKTMHYLNHNDKYFTFDAVPLNRAQEAAEEIYDILLDAVTIKKK